MTPLMRASKVWDPPAVANGAQTTTTITKGDANWERYGLEIGDYVVAVSFSTSLGGLILTAYVSNPGVVTVVLSNLTGGVIDLESGTLRVAVKKHYW